MQFLPSWNNHPERIASCPSANPKASQNRHNMQDIEAGPRTPKSVVRLANVNNGKSAAAPRSTRELIQTTIQAYHIP